MKPPKKAIEIDKTLIKSFNRFPVVGIGASAGGLDAFKKLLKAIPEDSGMAYVLVQHLDPNHESMLVELLQKVTPIPVLEITNDIKVQPDHIYIIPSNKMMIATDGVLELSPRPSKNKNERNLPIDLFFTSLAEVHQSHAIGVVLSGTATDGTIGLKAIKDHGGITFAQDEQSAQFAGMPHSAAEAGVVDFIMSPHKIPQKLLEIISITKGNEDEDLPKKEEVFKQILALLRIRKGTDFTYYKQSTIRRRILRRMAINKNEDPLDYLKFLRDRKSEQDLLYQDLLIPVTDFFRDPKIFESLREVIFPLIVKNNKEGEPIRIWVAGCSTGEEVYSIAICLKELLAELLHQDGHQKVQIFATDISEPAIAKARNGIYTKSEVKGLSEDQLKENFNKCNGGYQAQKIIRDLCVFAVHNFLKDPPFSKMDFISCRNVLIYMEPYLQKKALTTFHYALNPKGFLMLGKSETTSGVPDHYTLSHLQGVAKTDKIYSRKEISGRFVPNTTWLSQKYAAGITQNNKSEILKTDFQKKADEIILSKYTPPGVVVNEAMDIVHFRGSTGNFLEPSPGKATLNLLKMAKDGLAFELRNVLYKAKRENITITKENIPILINGSPHNITIEAIPLTNIIEPHYLVLFHHQLSNSNLQALPKNTNSKTPLKISSSAKDLYILQLEKELAQSREDMRIITEEQEAANEELQSANEELLSGSEELQSLNEEMETSKEELQSTNEELIVVNQEINGLNEQITEAKDFAESIISTLHEPLLVLDKNLRIKKANAAFYKSFQVSEKDTVGKLIYELGNRQWNVPDLKLLLEDILPLKSMFENFEVRHNFPNVGERIVLLNAREIIGDTESEKLILLAIEDITIQKQEQDNLSLLSAIVDTSDDAIISKSMDGTIKSWNRGAEKIFGYTADEVLGKPIFMLMPLDSYKSEKMIIGKINKGEAVEQFETLRLCKDGSTLNVSITVSPIKDRHGNVTGASDIARDITAQKNAIRQIEESEQRFRNLVEQSMYPILILKGEDMILDMANEPLYKIWNVGKEALGKPILEILPEMKDQPFINMLLEVFHTHTNQYGTELPAYFIRENGEKEIVYFNFVYQPYREQDGIVSGVIVFANDVTRQVIAHKKVEESEERFRLLADNVPLNIFIIEPTKDASISYWNQYWLDYTGQTMEEALGTAWGSILHADDFQGVMDIFIPAFESRLPYHLPDIRLRRHDGEYRWFAVQGNPRFSKTGEFIGYIGVSFDIHQQKLVEQELIDAKESAENVAKSKQQFLSNMSHEIRTPLNSIIGFTNVLLKTPLDEKQKEYARALEISGKSLSLLINDILDLAKVDAGKMTFETLPFNLHNSIQATVHTFDLKIKEKNLNFICEIDNEIPSVLLGDSLRLNQIMLNLISNAIKFTHKGEIKLNIKIIKEDEVSMSIEFIIVDTGIGIAEDKLNSIFNLFEQAEINTSHTYGGTGLGLAIVKQLVEFQGGNISVTSKKNEGSKFKFILPFGKTSIKSVNEINLLEPNSKIQNLRILVAEDVALNQLLIKIILCDFGFNHDVVNNGQIVIEKLKDSIYDIILMDLQMPQMNGFEATEYIRKTMKSDIPIIALTADVTTMDLAKCKACGMNDYISKPIDENQLYQKIMELCKK